ncbi:spermatogenic leucine zipper protein 1 [Myotis daubentonii]|uniref:spermatogenic leucine zipper protein 1 n=1 Tax=Myotis daubentonii TaxID=98922 RepID=UPI002873F026|nr:spermatogenic leucine zipper protein 1 [Myotis daubentonii]
MEGPRLCRTPKPSPKPNRDALGSKTFIALLEIESLPPVSCTSHFSLSHSCHRETKQQATKKCEKLLKEIKEALQNMKCHEKKIAETKESSEETDIAEELSELKEKVRGLDKINKVLLKRLLFKEQSAKKQMMILENQSSDDSVQGLARDAVNPSEEGRAVNKTHLNKEKAESGSHHVQEENTKLKKNMEQLLQGAELWSVQHAELCELMKLYQKSQHNLRATGESYGIRFQTPLHSVFANYELEAQMRKLNHNTHSLHVITALLENECQILQHRVELLRELHRQKDAALHEKPIQVNCEQDREAGRCKQNMQGTEVTFQIRDRYYQNLDSCRNKKARNNRFNRCLAKALRRKKRPVSRLR